MSLSSFSISYKFVSYDEGSIKGHGNTSLPSIVKTLRPANAAQHTKALRLNDERYVESLRNCIHAEGHTRYRPYQHHCCRKTFCTLRSIVAPYLRCELYTPAHRPDGPQNIRRDWYRFLRCHCSIAISTNGLSLDCSPSLCDFASRWDL